MVHFVGAGSGAADLITVRGMKLLQQADVIIYAGSLVNPALLSYAPEGCEIYNSATMALEEVLDVIYAAEQFEPCRNTWMTRALKGEIAVSDSCKKAAREVLARYASGNYILETETGQKVNMKGYLFFMTPKAFERLKLKSKHIVLKDHVFFKSWIR